MPLSRQSTKPTGQTLFVPKKPGKNLRESIAYVPPDALMFDLFSAIQRRGWIRARRLCYELILCDPLRKNYHDLYERIDQIVKLSSLRTRQTAAPPPQPAVLSRKTTAGTHDTDRGTISRYDTLSYIN